MFSLDTENPLPISTTFSNHIVPITTKELGGLLTEKKLWNFEDSEAKLLDDHFQNLFGKSGVDRYSYEHTLRSSRSTGVIKYPTWYTDETKISIKKVSDSSYIVEILGTNFGNKFKRIYNCQDLECIKKLNFKELQYA